jgi:hypothetical protein
MVPVGVIWKMLMRPGIVSSGDRPYHWLWPPCAAADARKAKLASLANILDSEMRDSLALAGNSNLTLNLEK